MKAQKARLYSDVEYRNFEYLDSLARVCDHIKTAFIDAGLEYEEQICMAAGNGYKNIIATYNKGKKRRLIVTDLRSSSP